MSCTVEKINTLAREFRQGILACRKSLFITLQRFPNGACGDASYLLAKYFEKSGCGCFDYVSAEKRQEIGTHAWLEKDGVIVDITADQFSDQPTAILITSDRSWHKQFEEVGRWNADFERYDGAIVGNLWESYHLILENI